MHNKSHNHEVVLAFLALAVILGLTLILMTAATSLPANCRRVYLGGVVQVGAECRQ